MVDAGQTGADSIWRLDTTESETPMPAIYVDVLQGRTREELDTLLDTIHTAVIDAFGVPERDRYQIITQHRPGELVVQDTGLGVERTDAVVVIHVVSRMRTNEKKIDFYEALAMGLESRCGIAPTDLMVSITENGPADWSFAHGRAQFLTGEL